MLFCYQFQIFKTIIYSADHDTIYFEKYLRTAASGNLSDAVILTFRRHFRSNSLSAFYKVSVLKTYVKAHMLESLFKKFPDIKSEILLDERLHQGYFSLKRFYLKNTFLTAEAVVRGCSKKKVSLEILQNLQENTCATESFLIKLQTWALQLYLKKLSGTGVFLWNLGIF